MRWSHTAGGSCGAQGGPAQPPPPRARAARAAQGNPGSQPCAKRDRLVLTTSSRRVCFSTDPWHATPSSRALPHPAQGIPGIEWERTSPAIPRHPFDITVHQAEAPLALVLSQKSRKGRKSASLGRGSPATLCVLPGWPHVPIPGVAGCHWRVPAPAGQPRSQGPSGKPPHLSIHADLKAPSNICPPPHPPHSFPHPKAPPPARHLPCILLHPPAKAHNQVPKTIRWLNYGHPRSPPHQALASARLAGTLRPSHGAAAWHRRPPPAIGSCVTPTCF